MNLNDLTKEQKQYVFLGVLAVAAVGVLAWMGIRFGLSSINDSKQRLDDLDRKIENADRALSKRQQVSADYAKTTQLLKSHLKNLPPRKNTYSWAYGAISSNARLSGLEIDSIDEANTAQSSTVKGGAAGVQIEAYSIRITAHGSYESAKVFLRSMQESYPLVRCSGIEMDGGQDPEVHDIRLYIQWPFNLTGVSENILFLAEQDDSDPAGSEKEPTPPTSAPPARGGQS